MLEQVYFLYRHIRLDKNEPFYIGVGTCDMKNNTFKSRYFRAYTKNRNKHWKNIVSQTDYEIEILLESNDYEFIKQKEIEFIALYGRRDLGTGVLCNKTDGGDGGIGKVITDEIRYNLSQGQKNSKNTLKKGQKLPEWWCEKISNAVKGENNSMYGRTGELHPNSKKVINVETKKIYNSITEASEDCGLDMKALSLKLLWKVGNETNLVYLQEYKEHGEDLCKQMLEKSLIRKPKIKGIIDKVDGTFYKTIGELANKLNIKASTLRHQILKNKTIYEFIYEL